jgi:PAS domain S-box-containing protein
MISDKKARTSKKEEALSFLSGGGEMGERIRTRDWSKSPLGPPERWPRPLKLVVALLLNSKFPMCIAWGTELSMLYNDPYADILGAKHPAALAAPVHRVWAESWAEIEPLKTAAMKGEASYCENLPLRMDRHGYEEQTWFTFSYSPVRDEDGVVMGVFCAGVETTEQILSERRQQFRLTLLEQLRGLADPATIMLIVAKALGTEFGIARVGYGEIDAALEHIIVERDWTDGRLPTVAGRHCMSCFAAPLITVLKLGQTIWSDDVEADPRVDAAVASTFRAIGIRSGVAVPLIRAGRFAAMLFLHHPEPRRWTEDEAALATEVANRAWEAIERARAEEELRKNETRFRALATMGSSSIYRMSPGWEEVYRLYKADSPAGDATKIPPDWLRYIHPDDRLHVLNAIETAIRTRSALETEHRARLENSELAWVHVRAVPIFDANGKVVEWFGAGSDVTARRQAEERLRQSEEQLRLATEAAEIGLWDVDVIAGTLFWQARVKAMSGISPDVPVSMADFYAGLHPEDHDRVAAAYVAAVDPTQRALYDVEYRTIGKEDGRLRRVAAKGRGIFDNQGRCVRVIGTAIDITRRRADEERLRELNETLERQVAQAIAERKLLADIVEGTDVFVQVVDLDHRWLAINKAAAEEFARLFGVERPKVGDNILEALRDRPEQQALIKAVLSRALAGEEFIETAKFGIPPNERDLEIRVRALRDENGRVIGAYQFAHDVTERLREQARLKEAEAALVQMQKMEAIGQLTGGIAHDFNNLLGTIVGSFELIHRAPEDIQRVRYFADSGLKAAQRGAKLTGQLLAFSRSQRFEFKPLRLAEVVGDMRDLLVRTLGPMIRLKFDLNEGHAQVLSDPTQIEMAVLNLAINARDAMPKGGDLIIATAIRRFEKDAEVQTGEYVELSVIDTGAGMPPDVLARAFDPFFTTKGVGKGTGLGLSQVYGIARQAGGTVRISSQPGCGTAVRLYLPRTTIQRRTEEEATTNERGAVVPTATILVIEDDPDVRSTLLACLETIGYRVIEAEDGPSGLNKLRENAPDLIMVDFAMPGMNGAEVAKAVRAMRPGLPIVFASGYSETAAIEEAAGRDALVLRKPFGLDDLRTVVAEALEA